jgi:hypothetical protein
MLHAIAVLGGWLLMMGQHDRSESLFYYFRIEHESTTNDGNRVSNHYQKKNTNRKKLP